MKKTLLYVVSIFFLLPILVFAADNPASYTDADPWIETDKDIYNYGEEIRVHFYNAPGYASDWICIVPSGSGETEAGDYKYLPEGLREGLMIFKTQLPGEYEVRAYYNYSSFRYIVSARYHFTIAGDEYGYGYQNEYVDVPITYGEPMYYTPPVSVTFAFDYFMYENVGGFVDIVFWRGGHRYQHKPWYHNGRRISPYYIRSINMHNRIRNDEFFRHRERLQKNHNINHPDSYYGLKARPQKPTQQWQGQKDQHPQWGQQPSQQTKQRPQWEQNQPPQVRKQPQQLEQRPKWEQKKTPQIRQRPRQSEQKPQWGQEQLPQVRRQPQQSEQRPQWGQRQSREIRQRSQQLEQKPQLEKKSSRQIEKQKPLQEKHKEIKER